MCLCVTKKKSCVQQKKPEANASSFFEGPLSIWHLLTSRKSGNAIFSAERPLFGPKYSSHF
jgi:hypothetical protein